MKIRSIVQHFPVVSSVAWGLVLAGFLGCLACQSEATSSEPPIPTALKAPLTSPVVPAHESPVRFAVLSDLHLYDTATMGEPELELTEGSLSSLSPEIVETVVRQLASLPLDFVLIAGDLTHDGELPSHQRLVRSLGHLTAAGKKVFVVPGNHDIDNPNARSQ
jgi:metallophosphoesterase superfamily enzyme